MNRPTGRCEHCGKYVFYSNKEAKRWAKNRLDDGEKMSTYRCYYNNDYIHIGHTPGNVKAGEVQRGGRPRRTKYWLENPSEATRLGK